MLVDASMRPPLNAGENGLMASMFQRSCVVRRRFNEAPAERGGKRAAHWRNSSEPNNRAGFNEAPAERGGKPCEHLL